MPSTEPNPTASTRDKERTRGAILEAAHTLFFEQGAGVSMADIARTAGVSKGALTHHFHTRSDLMRAVGLRVSSLFRDEVHRHVDLSENTSGKLLRGYIRALTSESELMRQTFAPSSFLSVIGLEHPLLAFNAEDAQEWREDFSRDGIDQAHSLALRFAAEGLAASIDTPYLTPAELVLARDHLLALATPEHPTH